jgi:hypothetical protein
MAKEDPPQESTEVKGCSADNAFGVMICPEPVIVPNSTPGIIYGSDRNGKPVRITVDKDGKLTSEFTKKEQAEALKRTREILNKEADAMARAKIAEEAAIKAEKERLNIGNIAGASVAAGCAPDLPGGIGDDKKKEYKIEIGKPDAKGGGDITLIKKKIDLGSIPHLGGCYIEGKAKINPAAALEKIGAKETAKKVKSGSETIEELQKKYDDAMERVKKPQLKS